jgi:hypothetical protein
LSIHGGVAPLRSKAAKTAALQTISLPTQHPLLHLVLVFLE